MEKIPYEQLRYRIIGASTEDPENPIYSIISPLQNDGWSSVRFCSYPQEILIQFTEPVRLTRVHLLLHQSKIPSKIELYQFFPKNYNDFYIDINSMIFDKIGYVIPNPNSQSNYKARELKRIFLNENVLFLKFVFYKSTYNIFNPFDQVGLVGLECFGYKFTQSTIDFLFPFRDKHHDYYINRKEREIPDVDIKDEELDEICLNKIYDLKQKLEIVIQDENYEYAKIISDVIRRIRFLGSKINNLNHIKIKSIEVEDYDNANLMKIEVERIKKIIESINPDSLGTFNKSNTEKEVINYEDNSENNYNEHPTENPPFEIESERSNKPKTRSDEILEEKKKKEALIQDNKERAKKFLEEEKIKEEESKMKLTHGQNQYMDELEDEDKNNYGNDNEYSNEDSVREQVRSNYNQ